MDGLVVGALGVITVGASLGYWLMTRGQRAVGKPRLEVPLGPFGLGDVVSCRLSTTVASKVKIESVTLALRCEEVVRWTERERRSDGEASRLVHRQHEETVWAQERDVAVDRELQPGQPFLASAEFTIPEAGAPSFDAEHNCIRWRVTLRMAMPGRPDYTREKTITVEPRRSSASARVA
jgi:hypothetical protein